MGVFNKIKNIFFEEEYVEVEEDKKPKKESKKEKTPAVAKKLDLPEIKREAPKEVVEEEPEEVIELEDKEEKEVVEEPKFKFPMVFEEDDFKEEADPYSTPIEEQPEEPKEEVKYHFENERVPLYEGREEKKEKPIFRPTPIISPIYGILDKNYKKEEIVTKKPIVLSTGSSRKVDLDTVRQKAYGDLASDITASMMDDAHKEKEPIKQEKPNIEKEEENDFYDLNVNSPAVNKVTVGDAEEYFNDLGLEYNVDYKDTSVDKVTGRRSDKKEDKVDEPLENNIFDLLESMYDDKEEE